MNWLGLVFIGLGIHGGTACRGIAGFGRGKNFHEERFFELASDVPIEVNFMLSEEEAGNFLESLRKEKLDLFYVKIPAEYGSLSE